MRSSVGSPRGTALLLRAAVAFTLVACNSGCGSRQPGTGGGTNGGGTDGGGTSGGASGGAGGTSTPTLTFSPATLTANLQFGQSTTLTVRATASDPSIFTGSVY